MAPGPLLTIGVIRGLGTGASLTIRTAADGALAVGVFLALVALVYLVSPETPPPSEPVES